MIVMMVLDVLSMTLCVVLTWQAKPQDIGGYYKPDHSKAEPAMRPSKKFNDILGTSF